MTEVKFSVVKPNLYVLDDQEVIFGVDSSDVIRVSRSVDEVVRMHIGELRIRKSNLDTINTGSGILEDNKGYTEPLGAYLDAVEGEIKKRGTSEIAKGITTSAARLFGLNYLINASTAQYPSEVAFWLGLQGMLKNADKIFVSGAEEEVEGDIHIRIDKLIIVNREKTLEKMRKAKSELDPKMPDNYAEFYMVRGEIPRTDMRVRSEGGRESYVGRVGFQRVKAEDRTKIGEARSELVERLKEVGGPCLSLDAHSVLSQHVGLFEKAPGLIAQYGDVLMNPDWRARFFKLDY